MKVFGLVGLSGSGKTTLMVQLLPELIGRGLRVSTMKHTHHAVDLDRPGKDSYRHREAGASEVVIASSARWALMHEYRGEPEWEIDALIERMTPVDLLLVEGFKRYPHPKMEVWRPATGKRPIYLAEPSVVAVATDGPLPADEPPGRPPAVLDINDVAAVADFVVAFVGLAGERRHAAG